MYSVTLMLALSTASLAPNETPAYKIEAAPAQTVEAVLTYEVKAPKLTAKEWILFAALLPELPCQSKVKSRMEPDAKDIHELSDQRRLLLMARIPAKTRDLEGSVKIEVHHEATLYSRRLVARKPDDKVTEVAALEAGERKAALETSKSLDFQDKAFQKWLDDKGLRQEKNEDTIAFARRVFLFIKKNYAYYYGDNMKWQATLLCKEDKTDCGGMSMLFVATLRANKVPARLLVGRWASSAKKDEKTDKVNEQTHVKAEFHADDIGWVPVDLSSAVIWDKSKEGLDYFGKDKGDFIVMHVDPDLTVDTIHFGKHDIRWLQGGTYWVSGSGKLDGATIESDWRVKKVK